MLFKITGYWPQICLVNENLLRGSKMGFTPLSFFLMKITHFANQTAP